MIIMSGTKSWGKNWKVDVIIYQKLSENYAEAGHGGMIRGLIWDKVKASHRAIGVFARTDEVVYIKIDSPKKNKKTRVYSNEKWQNESIEKVIEPSILSYFNQLIKV